MLGPYGTGNPENCAIQNGKCSDDSGFFSHEEVATIAKCALAAYDKHIQASFFWTGHNEIEAKWDYIKAWDNGWINKTEVATPSESLLTYAAQKNERSVAFLN